MAAGIAGEAVGGIEARPLVLIVDDELIIREALADALTDYGYDTITAAEGEEALAAFERHDIAALVTDLYMGGSDGFVLISALRDRGRALPIIAMSGSQNSALALARALGADTTLAKPFRPAALVDALDRLLARAETAAAQ
jgi:CheY-like chemotaxis protein